MLDYGAALPTSYSVDDGGSGTAVTPGSLSPPERTLLGPNFSSAMLSPSPSPLPYQSALSGAGPSPLKQRRRVAGAPRRRVGGAPSASTIQSRRMSGAGEKLLPQQGSEANQSASNNSDTEAGSDAGVTSSGAAASPLQSGSMTSPFHRRVSLTASPVLRHQIVGSDVSGGTSSPARRRIKGAPKPVRRRNRPSAFAAAGSVLSSSKYAVNSAEANMEKFRAEMEKNNPKILGSPKGSQKWGRVKQRVQWQEGDSCAVCMSEELTGRVKPCGHRSMCEACYKEVLSEGRGVYCPSCFAEVERLLPDSVSSGEPDGGDESDSGWDSFGSPLADQSQAKLHLRASMAGTKLDRPELCGTTAVEIAQAFGTGVGTMFLHLNNLFLLMVLLAVLSLPTLLANVGGIRNLNRQSLNPSPLVSTTLGNCGNTSCNVGEKW